MVAHANNMYTSMFKMSYVVGSKMLLNSSSNQQTMNTQVYTVNVNTTHLSSAGGGYYFIYVSAVKASIAFPNFCDFVNISNCTNTIITIQVKFLYLIIIYSW